MYSFLLMKFLVKITVIEGEITEIQASKHPIAIVAECTQVFYTHTGLSSSHYNPLH